MEAQIAANNPELHTFQWVNLKAIMMEKQTEKELFSIRERVSNRRK